MAVLGLSTNTRLISAAILSHGELIEYFTHLHKSAWSPHKATEIIAGIEPCVRKYCITRVILSSPYAYHQSNNYPLLHEALIGFFQSKGIETKTKTPETFYTFCPEGKKKTKKEMMKAMASQFPELSYCYHKELRNKNKYYIKLFEAVALATLYGGE